MKPTLFLTLALALTLFVSGCASPGAGGQRHEAPTLDRVK